MSNVTRFVLRCTRCEHQAAVYATTEALLSGRRLRCTGCGYTQTFHDMAQHQAAQRKRKRQTLTKRNTALAEAFKQAPPSASVN